MATASAFAAGPQQALDACASAAVPQHGLDAVLAGLVSVLVAVLAALDELQQHPPAGAAPIGSPAGSTAGSTVSVVISTPPVLMAVESASAPSLPPVLKTVKLEACRNSG